MFVEGFTFYVEYSNLTCCDFFLNSTFILDIFNSDFSFSAESNQETASLPIDKSPDKCEVGRLGLKLKTTVVYYVVLMPCWCVPFAFRVLFLLLLCIRVETMTSPIIIT